MEQVKIYSQTVFRQDPRRDSVFRLMFVLKGEFSFFVGPLERHLSVHDITFIRPFEMNGGGSASEDCKVLVLDIGADLWKLLCPNLDKITFSISILKSAEMRSSYHAICRALAQILYYATTSEDYTSARICLAVSDILAVLTEEYARAERTERHVDQTSQRIADILQYIIDNYTRRFSLEEISGAIGFHPQYFSAYFRKHFGISFTDYLNHYRVTKSAAMLQDSAQSILDIALACGFNSHKTFSNAFEKTYGCSPREYRRSLKNIPPAVTEDLPEAGDDYEFLRQFWNRARTAGSSIEAEHDKYTIQLQDIRPEYRNVSHNFISIGRAISCLRSDMQKQLLRARKDLNPEYARIRDIFSDDLFVYYEDRNKTPSYSWRALDEIFDFLISIDLKPFIEIGYMPAQLASRKQYAGWQYHPNVSFPRSLKQWEHLVESFIRHLLHRYGQEQVESWLFDFWTSPNLRLEHGYWNETMETFFRFYRVSFEAVKKIDPKIRMGSPNFSYPSGYDCYRQFLEYTSRHHFMPDFISTHLYSCGDGEDNPAQSFIEYSVFDNNYHIPNIKPKRYTIPEALGILQSILDRFQSGLPIIVDDWNVTFFPTDYTRDTCFMAPFVIENYFSCCRKVYGMGFASFSDIHEDFFNTDQLFNGGPGLLTYSGIPKASYHAMAMAYRFSRSILRQGTNYIIGRTETGFELLLYNMHFYNDSYVGNDPTVISFTNRYNVFAEGNILDFHIVLPVENGSYSITESIISRSSGSSYDAWIRMGSPSELTPEMSQYLNRISTPEMRFEMNNVSRALVLDVSIEPHSVMHMEIRKL